MQQTILLVENEDAIREMIAGAPGRSGFDIARRIRRREATKDVPIIMLTARCDG